MPVNPEDILAMGKGPVQMTWADQNMPPTAPVTTPPPTTAAPATVTTPEPETDPSGLENVNYDTVTAKGAPNNPKNAAEVVQRGVVNVANPQTETDVEHVTSVPEQQTAPKKKKLSYVEMFQQMSPYKPPTPEELEKERKKQKREAIFAAIGEGISAMSNLYFTTQYAPNAYDPSKGMAATTKARFDQLKKDHEENQRQYMEGFMRAMRWDAEDERDDRNWQHTIEREKITDRWRQEVEDRKRDKDEFDAQKRQLDLKYLQGKIDRQDYLNEQERLETDYMKKHGMKMPTTPKPSSGRGGGSHSSSGRGGSGMKQYPAYNPTTGETIYITAKDSKHAWSQCPQGFTIRQEPSSTVTDRTSGSGRITKTTHQVTTKNSNDNLDGPRRRDGKKPNPMDGSNNSGSGSKKKKKNPMS